jgi:hypothetical protein
VRLPLVGYMIASDVHGARDENCGRYEVCLDAAARMTEGQGRRRLNDARCPMGCEQWVQRTPWRATEFITDSGESRDGL